MTREQAIEIARACAKAKPQSYYAEPFEPHEWVIDAIMEAVECDEEEHSSLADTLSASRELLITLSMPQGRSVVNAWASACYHFGLANLEMSAEAFVQYVRERAAAITRRKLASEQDLVAEMGHMNRELVAARSDRDKFAGECRRLDAELRKVTRDGELVDSPVTAREASGALDGGGPA